MNRSEVPAITNYTLSKPPVGQPHAAIGSSLKRLGPLVAGERKRLTIGFAAVVVSSVSSLLAPLIIGHTVDTYIQTRNFAGVVTFSTILMVVYVTGMVATYLQTVTMGGVGRQLLFALRNVLFAKLQELPLAFFNENKAGDLISRINNDTDKVNQFFSQGLMQFMGNVFMMAGAAIFLLLLNVRLGLAALAPAAGVLLVTRALSSWVKRKNVKSLQSLGGLSAEIQENLGNFKVIVAFNRRDYFRRRFGDANDQNFSASVASGVASNIFIPIYGLSFNLAQVVMLSYGIYLIEIGRLTVGLLIGFLLYVNSFYMPLRQLAAVWSQFQLALAGLDRISEVLAFESNMPIVAAQPTGSASILAFEHVSFRYPSGPEVLTDATFALERGRTYALVGPTGGGKTTTASLMARLYDPSVGRVLLDGRDIRSYGPAERAAQIGFILQEPFLFTGTIKDNVVYGNDRYKAATDEQLTAVLIERNLDGLLSRFEAGLGTKVTAGGETISLGQKQLIAFMRAVLRDPALLVLDEATANIDTVTEQQLEQILARLPASTTKVVIAHRLNTIANADEIFFINAREITPAGSIDQALDMLLHGHRDS